MNVYTLTFSDYVNSEIMLIGTFSSYEKAWNALLADKDENMEGIKEMKVEIDSNLELGIGSYIFSYDDADLVNYSYNVNVTELDEVLDANHQVEL